MWIVLRSSVDRALLAVQQQSVTSKALEMVAGQFIALVAFFAFPAIQYLLLRRFSRKEGNPELWYLPRYGFRLVIRNLPGRHTLSEIRNRALTRKLIPAGAGATVATIQDEIIIEREDFFLFAGTDQILINFQLRGEDVEELMFVMTDKLGNELKSAHLGSFDRLVCDYTATVNNTFNFNVKLAKRIELRASSMAKMWGDVQRENVERRFEVDRIRNVA